MIGLHSPTGVEHGRVVLLEPMLAFSCAELSDGPSERIG